MESRARHVCFLLVFASSWGPHSTDDRLRRAKLLPMFRNKKKMEQLHTFFINFFMPICPACNKRTASFTAGCSHFTCRACAVHYCSICLRGYVTEHKKGKDHMHRSPCYPLYTKILNLRNDAKERGWKAAIQPGNGRLRPFRVDRVMSVSQRRYAMTSCVCAVNIPPSQTLTVQNGIGRELTVAWSGPDGGV